MVARAKAGRSHAPKSWLRVQRLCNNLHEKCNFFRETLRYKDFDRRQAVRNGTGNSPTASVLNPRLNGSRCISTKNKKIAVTVTLYQNNRDSVVEEGGFEPPKSVTADLQSAPFGRSGTLPYSVLAENWSWWTDSNPRPADYKSAALPTELHQHRGSFRMLKYYTTVFWFRQEFF